MTTTSDTEGRLRHLAERARQESAPEIDVTTRVLESVSQVQRRAVVLDTTPLWFGGAIAAVAAGFMFVFFPSFSTITEPWISFCLM